MTFFITKFLYSLFIQVVRQLCKLNAGRHGMDPVGLGGFQTKRPPRPFEGRGFGGGGGGDDEDGPPPAKRGPGFNSMFGGRGYGAGGGFRGGRGGGGCVISLSDTNTKYTSI